MSRFVCSISECGDFDMQTIRYIGIVLPETMQIKTQGHPTIHWKNPNTNIHVDLDVSFDGNTVTVTCNLHSFDIDSQIPQLTLIVHNMVHASLDLICFKTGDAISVFLQKAIFPDGKVVDIQPHEYAFAGLAKSLEKDGTLGPILELAIRDPNLMLALRDLADSIRHANESMINCARAIESIRNHFVPEGKKKDDGWPIMHAKLNLTKSYLQLITDASRDPRHGNRWSQPAEPLEIGRRAWITMDRFLEYRRRGDQQLPLDKFPRLS
jgi:hypothetical protein